MVDSMGIKGNTDGGCIPTIYGYGPAMGHMTNHPKNNKSTASAHLWDVRQTYQGLEWYPLATSEDGGPPVRLQLLDECYAVMRHLDTYRS